MNYYVHKQQWLSEWWWVGHLPCLQGPLGSIPSTEEKNGVVVDSWYLVLPRPSYLLPYNRVTASSM